MDWITCSCPGAMMVSTSQHRIRLAKGHVIWYKAIHLYVVAGVNQSINPHFRNI